MIREEGALQVKSLAKSFLNAYKGIIYCIKNERNMRIHLTVTFYVLIFSPFYQFPLVQMLLLFITIGMVLFAEAVNTAIEALVNLETQCYDHLARIAKDVAAGAVLICSVFAVIVGVNLYIKPEVISHIFAYMLENWVLGILFLVSIPICVLFIFGFPFRRIYFYKKQQKSRS